MDILKKVLENWDNILTIIVLGLLAMNTIRNTSKRLEEMSPEERKAYIKRLLENLIPIALVLVTDAEIDMGGGTGKLKRSRVIDELYKRIPDEYKKYVTEDNLDAIINRALVEAERLWKDNRKVQSLMISKSFQWDVEREGGPANESDVQ